MGVRVGIRNSRRLKYLHLLPKSLQEPVTRQQVPAVVVRQDPVQHAQS
jgi:hypothetical protein